MGGGWGVVGGECDAVGGGRGGVSTGLGGPVEVVGEGQKDEMLAGMGVCVTGREGECLYAAQEALEIAFPSLGAAAAAAASSLRPHTLVA